ncbi:MAG: DUF1573 domain-containing protein [Bacteroidetes bacterium]|jgi:hypothetical protein|nr:DUF1573 domain-containing protein [Bacteroidota bacterium]MBK7505498.1 DUF1573 domain-containing protein [Bacteroidota bacterium]MBK7639435.1 DUF1573 domain-containing protein [Bacteroidota bacterium]MBK8671841.1 DUF1573 domain-containing protein [Bacteroidota bacterium]MBK9355303.1 DUF1573 domain-containing protein [Bacteroidota bacterium]
MIMKKLLTICLMFIGLAGINAQEVPTTPVPLPDGSKIVFKETEYNFNSRPMGTPVSHEFVFKNEGTAPLTLTNVKASCGCTTPSWTKEPIAPGETGKVAAEYNMARAGGFNKSITVTTAGGETVVLYIKGEALSTENQNSVDETKPSIISEPK